LKMTDYGEYLLSLLDEENWGVCYD
jgi:hypothetical protein